MSEEKRNHLGFVVPPDPTFAAAGENSNPKEYADGIGKTKPAADGATTLPDGSPKYAADGCTTDWFATHPK
ncbi:MAG: hypothetical protein ABSB39_14665 [Candidatus Sulfotelmatobacter sp.]|jgi:hypothetical protein